MCVPPYVCVSACAFLFRAFGFCVSVLCTLAYDYVCSCVRVSVSVCCVPVFHACGLCEHERMVACVVV